MQSSTMMETLSNGQNLVKTPTVILNSVQQMKNVNLLSLTFQKQQFVEKFTKSMA